jgi:hypothetical protein
VLTWTHNAVVGQFGKMFTTANVLCPKCPHSSTTAALGC